MSDETLRALVIGLLSTGGAAFIWTMARSILAFRNSAESREDRAVARLETYERDAREQLRCERIWGAYWHRVAGLYEWALVRNGIELPPVPPEPDRMEHLTHHHTEEK